MAKTRAKRAGARSKAKASAVLVDTDADFGKIRHRWPFVREALRALGSDPEVILVSAARPVPDGVAAALALQVDRLFVLGDDATSHHAVNTLLATKAGARPALGLLCAGVYSQSFFPSLVPGAQRMNETERLQVSTRAAVHGTPVAVDLGFAEYRGKGGREASRYFLNIASFGLSARVFEALPDVASTVHSGLAFAAACARALASFDAPSLRLVSGARLFFREAPVFNLFIANGGFGMGGLRIAPEASVTDGRLDALLIPDAPVAELMMELPKLLLPGKEIAAAARFSAREFRASLHGARPKHPHRLLLDGVLVDGLPARFQAKPRALQMLALN